MFLLNDDILKKSFFFRLETNTLRNTRKKVDPKEYTNDLLGVTVNDLQYETKTVGTAQEMNGKVRLNKGYVSLLTIPYIFRI